MIYPFDYNYFPLNQIAKNKFINISSISNNKFIFAARDMSNNIQIDLDLEIQIICGMKKLIQ